MSDRSIAIPHDARFRRLAGVGGIGTGMLLAVEGDRTIGRTESRAGRLVDVHDYCKLHTVAHHVAVLLGARPTGVPFHVAPIGVVGRDDAGARMIAEMRAAGMDVAGVRTDDDRPTLFSVCFQYPDGDGGNVTTSDSAAAALSAHDVDAAADLLDGSTIALAQPEVPLEPRARLLELAGPRGSLRAGSFLAGELADAREAGLFGLVDLVSLNREEAAAIVERPLDTADPGRFLEKCAAAFGAPERELAVIVTAGGGGAYAVQDGRWAHRPAPAVRVASTAGCGDALLAGVLAGLASGLPLMSGHDAFDDALSLGVLVGSLNATSPHTIHPDVSAAAVRDIARSSGIAVGGALARMLGALEVG